jgi:hypothetical protein
VTVAIRFLDKQTRFQRPIGFIFGAPMKVGIEVMRRFSADITADRE